MDQKDVKSLERLATKAKDKITAINEEVDLALSDNLSAYADAQEATLAAAEELYVKTADEVKNTTEAFLRKRDEEATQTLLQAYRHQNKEEE